MRYQLEDEKIVTGEYIVEVPKPTTIPARQGIGPDGEPVEVAEEIVMDLYNIAIKDLTEEQRQQLSITILEEPVRLDDRFYWDGDVNRPKDLPPLKSFWIGQVKMIAGQTLAHTDWQVTKALETDVPMNAGVKAFRASVRDYSNVKEDAIDACTTVEELIEQVSSIQFPTQED